MYTFSLYCTPSTRTADPQLVLHIHYTGCQWWSLTRQNSQLNGYIMCSNVWSTFSDTKAAFPCQIELNSIPRLNSLSFCEKIDHAHKLKMSKHVIWDLKSTFCMAKDRRYHVITQTLDAMGYSIKYPSPPLWTTLNWVPKNFRISKKDNSSFSRIPNLADSKSWGMPQFC